MYRGTTPTLRFNVPDITFSDINKVYVTFSQEGKNSIEFTKEQIQMDSESNQMSVTLSQHDTLKLNDRYKVSVQLRIKMNDGSALASQVFKLNVDEILKDGEI